MPSAFACGTPTTVPGAPTGLASPSQTSSSVTLSWIAPTTGGALDTGTYTAQFVTHGGTFPGTTGATVRYCTNGVGTAVDTFGNSWAITGGVVTVNTFPAGVSGSVTDLLIVNGVVWQHSTNWWGWQPTAGSMNSAAAAAVSWNINPGTTISPLTAVVVSGLAVGTYDFRVLVSNTVGTSAPSAVLQSVPN